MKFSFFIRKYHNLAFSEMKKEDFRKRKILDYLGKLIFHIVVSKGILANVENGF